MSESDSAVLNFELSKETYGQVLVGTFLVQSIIGVFSFGCCLSVIMPIAYHPALRTNKAFALAAFLAAFDSFNSFAWFSSGLYRVLLELKWIDMGDLTNWHCFFAPFNLMWNLALDSAVLVLCAISVDRIIQIKFPLKYLKLTTRYIFLLMMGPAIFGITEVVAAFILQFDTLGEKADPVCAQYLTLPDSIRKVQSVMQWLGPTLSVLLYGVVVLMYAKHAQKVQDSSVLTAGGVTQQQKLQLAFTKSFAYSSMFTLFFVVLPQTIISSFVFFEDLTDIVMDFDECAHCRLIILWLWVVASFNPVFNAFIFFKRHAPMKTGFKAMWHRKTMAANLTLWRN